MPINDDPMLEREADAFGARPHASGERAMQAVQPDAGRNPSPPSPTPAVTPVQRRIIVGGQRWTKRQLQEWKRTQALTERQRELLNKMRADQAVDYAYPKAAKLRHGTAAAERREAWYAQGGGDTSWTMSPYDPEYKRLHATLMANHRARPYATDALHETGPLMGAWMNNDIGTTRRLFNMGVSALSPSTWTGRAPASRPGLEITRMRALRHPGVKANYATAKAEIEQRTGAANERELYSGHGVQGMNFIEAHGHDPSYGQFDGSRFGKGHGAHGRGAYFTDRVDKAVSYSAKGQADNEERSFFVQDVLLGNERRYRERGRYRRRHHNEMVRTNRNPGVNKTVQDGDPAPAAEHMSQYDSLVGEETALSGNGLIGTFRDRARFDSTEYMIRNADQVLPRYRVYYRLRR